MGQKSKNAGSKKSKPSSNKPADSKSICGNISRANKTITYIDDNESYLLSSNKKTQRFWWKTSVNTIILN